MNISACRQTYAAKHRHAWGDCEGGMVVPPSRSIHAKMGTFGVSSCRHFVDSLKCSAISQIVRNRRTFLSHMARLRRKGTRPSPASRPRLLRFFLVLQQVPSLLRKTGCGRLPVIGTEKMRSEILTGEMADCAPGSGGEYGSLRSCNKHIDNLTAV